MEICRILLFAAAVAGSAPLMAAPEIRFIGYLTTAGEARVTLQEVSSGITSDWMTQGATFKGWTIVRYVPESETLVVRSAGDLRNLPLDSTRNPNGHTMRVSLDGNEIEIRANEIARIGTTIVFRGDVRGRRQSLWFVCEEARFETTTETLTLEKSVKVARNPNSESGKQISVVSPRRDVAVISSVKR